MRCSRCDTESYPLTYIPTLVSKIARKIKYGKWVCPRCLTDEEAGGPKAKLLGILRASLSKPPAPRTILREEYLYALEAAAFRCPKRRRQEDCNGHPCPRRPKSVPTYYYGDSGKRHYRLDFLDYYAECVRSLQAHMLAMEVIEGKVLLAKGLGGWEAQLP